MSTTVLCSALSFEIIQRMYYEYDKTHIEYTYTLHTAFDFFLIMTVYGETGV